MFIRKRNEYITFFLLSVLTKTSMHIEMARKTKQKKNHPTSKIHLKAMIKITWDKKNHNKSQEKIPTREKNSSKVIKNH